MRFLKTITCTALLFSFLAVSNIQTCLAESKAVPAASGPLTFNGTADLVDEVQIATGVSPDHQAITVLFRNLQADSSTAGRAIVDRRDITVDLPVQSGSHDVHVVQDIRGFVNLQGKARAVLIMQAAGKTTILDLKKPKSDVAKEPASKSVVQARVDAKAKAKASKGEAQKVPETAHDFYQRIEATLPAGRGYVVTFFLLVERDSAAEENAALLTIDSLDVELSAPMPKKQK